MKQIYLALSFSILYFFAHAQNPIPNPGFETNWSNGKPNGWGDSRDITQVTPGHSGTYAAKGEKSASTYPALISTTSGTGGITISQDFQYFNLYYQFNSVSS